MMTGLTNGGKKTSMQKKTNGDTHMKTFSVPVLHDVKYLCDSLVECIKRCLVMEGPLAAKRCEEECEESLKVAMDVCLIEYYRRLKSKVGRRVHRAL